MPLKLPCPSCRATLRLAEPYPAPGERVSCPACGGSLRIAYPDAVIQRLRELERVLTDADAAGPITVVTPSPQAGAIDFGAPRAPSAKPSPTPPSASNEPASPAEPPTRVSLHPPEPAPPTQVADPTPAPTSPTPAPRDDVPPVRARRTASPAAPPREPPPRPDAPPPVEQSSGTSWSSGAHAPPRRRWPARVAKGIVLLLILGVVGAGLGFLALQAAYQDDLPSIEALRAYRPATVTTVKARDGQVLGEIYEQRRYVLELHEIPQVVQDAFVAAEDAAFWEHGGIDYMGIARAMGRNLKAGRVSQGGSTITQQVAKNFLLSSDRRLERKIKEAFLSWRIEEAYGKEHILYLYLNEIFLGSQAYGVEAAARTFFGKPASELSLGEAAMIAGLPPRPSAWNPHADFSAAKGRQDYVLTQMARKGLITEAEAQAAREAPITIVPRGNRFREQSPHFTEHVRRHLVERYGEEKVLRDGLTVDSTCDLALQQHAQRVVSEGVFDVDQRMGFRRADSVHPLADDTAVQAFLEQQEQTLLHDWVHDRDPTGRAPAPETSVLEPGQLVDAVIVEVAPRWARVRIGAHTGIIPITWSEWVYPPDPERSWRYRVQDDLTRGYDLDGDRTVDGPLLRPRDVLRVKVVALSTRDEEVAEAFDDTPGAEDDLVAVRIWPVPEVESALLSLEVPTGAVRAMVGGADFGRSQLNRVVQSRRQVGSTFKPIVYTAAIASRNLTTASIVPDAPLAFGSGEEIWKPGNYGDDFKGNITLRQALALSRNTSTVRVLDAVDPAMTKDVIYDFARALGLGGTPTHLLPDDHVPTPATDHLCPWIPRADAGWCVDPAPGADRVEMCRACDLSMGLGSASLTMEELVRAYAVFANHGRWVEPWYVERVVDRDGEVLEQHEPTEPVQIMEPEVAAIGTWLMENVATSGTGAQARRELRVPVAGKTGTTNDEKDAWFVGFTPEVVTAVWVGYDQPRSLGVSSTGGRTSLPLWIAYMREALKDRGAPAFEVPDTIEWIPIDEDTGRRVTEGGREHPFLDGTIPEATGYAAGEASLEDLATEL